MHTVCSSGKKGIAVLIAALMCAACLVVSGCTIQLGGSKESKFQGVYDCTNMSLKDTSDNMDISINPSSVGETVTLTLAKDKTAALEMDDDIAGGTWKVKDGSTITLTLDGEDVEATLKDGTLSLSASEDTMTINMDFKKSGDAPDTAPKATASPDDIDTLLGGGSSSSSASGTRAPAVTGEATVVDDDTCTITILEKGYPYTSFNDTGFKLRVTNKQSVPIEVSAKYKTFSVNGKMCDPLGYITVQPGKYAEDWIYFDEEDVNSVDKLVGVEGVLEVENADTYDTIAEYGITIE